MEMHFNTSPTVHDVTGITFGCGVRGSFGDTTSFVINRDTFIYFRYTHTLQVVRRGGEGFNRGRWTGWVFEADRSGDTGAVRVEPLQLATPFQAHLR